MSQQKRSFPTGPALTTGLLLFTVSCVDTFQGTIPPAKVPVRSEVVEPAPFQPSLTLYGRVEPASRIAVRSSESGILRYGPRFTGGLRTGENVREGELLFTLDNEMLRLSHAEAELAVRSAEAELDRTRRGVEGGFMPEMDLKKRELELELAQERLESARLRLERLKFTAPGSGVLWVEEVIPAGTEIVPQTLLAEIAGEGRPRVEAWATSADLERLERGQAAGCRQPGSSVLVGQGRLTELARRVDRGGTVRLVVTIDEDRDMPPPGEGLEVEIRLAARTEALTLPEDAVIVDGGVAAVYVLEPHGSQYTARLRPVRSGSRSAGRIEILDGLKNGERVAVQGTEFLADGLLAVEADEG